MTPRFRPELFQFESREVPAAFSFTLPDGNIGSGQFSTPDGVDPAQAMQSFSLDDLSVTKGGVLYTTQPNAWAQYSYGALYGVAATATGPDTIYLQGTTAQVGSYSAPLALDGAETQVTFTLSDGTVGTISYDVPWDAVDASLPSQSVAPVNFRLNVAGQDIDTGTAGVNFTALPALQFQHGQATGITFAANTSGITGFQYSSFVASIDQTGANVIDAVKVGVGALPTAAIAAKAAQAAIYFNTGANDTKDTVLPTGTRVRIHVEAQFGPDKVTYDYDGTTIEGETVGDIAEQIQSNMAANGWDVSLSSNGKYIKVNGKKLENNILAPLTAAGINYSGMAQPVGPKTVGQVEQLVLQADGTWTPFES